MKRSTLLLLCLAILFSFSACFRKHIRFDDFADYKSDFETVAIFMRQYYTENGCSGRVLFDFLDGKILVESTVVSDQLSAETAAIVGKDLGYAWVEEDYIIFWNDETKTYGVLFSEDTKAAISSVKEWYTTLRTQKLDDYWYEIGQLHSI